MSLLAIEILCANCGFQLAYFNDVRDRVKTWSRILKMYKYKCPKCGHKLDPSRLETKEIKFYYRKTNPKPWYPKHPTNNKTKPWKPKS